MKTFSLPIRMLSIAIFSILIVTTAPSTAQPNKHLHFGDGAVLLFAPHQPFFTDARDPLQSNWYFSQAVLSPDGRYVAAFELQSYRYVIDKQYLHIWNLDTVNVGNEVLQLQPQISLGIAPNEGEVEEHRISLRFSSNSHYLAASLNSGLLVVDIQQETARVVNEYQVRGQVDWSADSRYVAGLVEDGDAFLLWDTTTGETTKIELEDTYRQIVSFGEQWLLLPDFSSDDFAVCNQVGDGCVQYDESGRVSALDAEQGVIIANLHTTESNPRKFVQATIWQRQADGSYQSLVASEWGDQFEPWEFSPNGTYLIGRNLSGNLSEEFGVSGTSFSRFSYHMYDRSRMRGTQDLYDFGNGMRVQSIDDLTRATWVFGDEYYVQWNRLMKVGNNTPLDVFDWASIEGLEEVNGIGQIVSDRVNIQGAPQAGNWVLYNMAYNFLLVAPLIQ
jgi:hypothetical protein